jgi:hypothetical protein
MNKSISYLTGGNNNFPKNTNNIKKNIINNNFLVWGKNKRSSSYCDDTKGEDLLIRISIHINRLIG